MDDQRTEDGGGRVGARVERDDERVEGPQPGEHPKERVDRELGELLEELRVALPGVQVLFAFLLTVPFSSGWRNVNETQRWAFFASFMLTALATALLIAPTAYHRIRFRKGDKRRMLFSSNRMAITGLALVALAVTGVVFMVTDVVIDQTWAAIIAAAVAGWFVWFWYGLPLSRKLADHRADRDRPPGGAR